MNDDAREDAAAIESLSMPEWISGLAGVSGVPGAGAACALMTASSAALAGMVAGYAGGEEPARIAVRAAEARRAALAAIERDAVQSGRLGDALRDRKESAEGDSDARDAAIRAAESAVALGELAASLISDLGTLLDLVERYLVPDVVVAAEGVAAALAGSSAVARADLRLAVSHGDPRSEDMERIRTRIGRLASARTRADEVRETAAARV